MSPSPAKTRLIGYAPVSTEDQATDPQLDELKAAGCVIIHQEHASGASRSRPVLAKLLQTMDRGETLVVVRLDRPARSVKHLLELYPSEEVLTCRIGGGDSRESVLEVRTLMDGY